MEYFKRVNTAKIRLANDTTMAKREIKDSASTKRELKTYVVDVYSL